jgi:hypothetical protein
MNYWDEISKGAAYTKSVSSSYEKLVDDNCMDISTKAGMMSQHQVMLRIAQIIGYGLLTIIRLLEKGK